MEDKHPKIRIHPLSRCLRHSRRSDNCNEVMIDVLTEQNTFGLNICTKPARVGRRSRSMQSSVNGFATSDPAKSVMLERNWKKLPA